MGTEKDREDRLLCPFKAGQADSRCAGPKCACAVAKTHYPEITFRCGLVPEHRGWRTPIIESHEIPLDGEEDEPSAKATSLIWL